MGSFNLFSVLLITIFTVSLSSSTTLEFPQKHNPTTGHAANKIYDYALDTFLGRLDTYSFLEPYKIDAMQFSGAEIYNGKLYGLSNVTRMGDVLVHRTDAQTLKVSIELSFKSLVFYSNYKYTNSEWFVKIDGNVGGILDKLNLKCEISLYKGAMFIPNVKVTHFGNARTRVTGAIINPALQSMIEDFIDNNREVVIQLVEVSIKKELLEFLNKIPLIPELVKSITG